jgi:hypothetical protein
MASLQHQTSGIINRQTTDNENTTEENEKFNNPSEHLAQMVQSIPFEVVKYEKNQVKDSILKSYVDSQIKKHLLESKYRNLENKINFIQLSIIFLSAISTFLQAIKDQINLNTLLGEAIYIFISSYTALLLSVSRFLKWETKKEEISKLIVNYAHVINKMRHQLRRIQNIDIELREKSWDDILKEFSKDNIEQDITKYNTHLDTILNASEKVYYQNKLQHIKVKGFINSKYDSMLNTISSKEHRNEIQISPYKKSGIFCCKVKYDTTRFLKDMETIVNDIEKQQRNRRIQEERKLQSKIVNDYVVEFDGQPQDIQKRNQTSSLNQYIQQYNQQYNPSTTPYTTVQPTQTIQSVQSVHPINSTHSRTTTLLRNISSDQSTYSQSPILTKSMKFVRKNKNINRTIIEQQPIIHTSILENRDYNENDTNNPNSQNSERNGSGSISSSQSHNTVIIEPSNNSKSTVRIDENVYYPEENENIVDYEQKQSDEETNNEQQSDEQDNNEQQSDEQDNNEQQSDEQDNNEQQNEERDNIE